MKSQNVKNLNLLVADLNVLFVKLHNYHWNIEGSNFYTLHNVTEELYNYVSTLYDDLAERILQLGEKPFSSLKEYLEVARINEEEKKNFSTHDVVLNVKDDLTLLNSKIKEAIKVAEELNDITTVNILSETVQNFEKQIWMLNAVLKG
jgi:starvation-inducible DNA-binding protein